MLLLRFFYNAADVLRSSATTNDGLGVSIDTKLAYVATTNILLLLRYTLRHDTIDAII